jgi:hypothetical protein
VSRSARRRLVTGIALFFFCGSIACERTEVRPPPPVIPPPPAEAAAPADSRASPEPTAPPAPNPNPAETPAAPKVESHYSGEQQPPAGLPDDVPLYAQAFPISSMTSPERGTIVNLRSSDSPDQVVAWYRDELPKRGWTIQRESGAGAQHLLTATKERRKATVLITSGSETQILLTVLEAK